jgi:hypothetical protein
MILAKPDVTVSVECKYTQDISCPICAMRYCLWERSCDAPIGGDTGWLGKKLAERCPEHPDVLNIRPPLIIPHGPPPG